MIGFERHGSWNDSTICYAVNTQPSIALARRCRLHEQEASRPVEHYELEVNSPPINQSIELCGPGVGIRFLREGSHDFHSFAELAKTLARTGMTDLEKALAVYRFSAGNFYHGSAGFGGTEMTRFINCYGYAYCWGQADFQHLLYEAVGLRARAPQLKGHSSTEVLIDGKWRMMDAFMRLLAPSPELDGLATGDELNRHPEIWEHIREGAVVELAKEYWLKYAAGNTYEPWQDSNAMLLTLRRRESLRIFDRGLGAWCLSPLEPADYVNGQWTWEPVLDGEHLAKEIESAVNVVAADDGLRANDASALASVEYRVESPYPLCTGTVAVQFRGNGKLRASVSADQRRTWSVLHEGAATACDWKLDQQLSVRQLPFSYNHDPLLRSQKREILLRLEWKGEAILTHVKFSFLVQIHGPSVPRLEPGINRWTLIGMSQGGLVRHAWDEFPDIHSSAVSPYVGEEVVITALVHNLQSKPARDVAVRFTESSDEALLGEITVPEIAAHGSAPAQLVWKAAFPGSKPYVRSTIQAQCGLSTGNGEWNEMGQTVLKVRPRPEPGFPDGLVWTNDQAAVREGALILRAAIVHLVDHCEGHLLYLPDTALTGTLRPYRGHPDQGGVPLGEPRKLENIPPSEFAVAEWRLAVEGLPARFTLWVEARFSEPVAENKRRILAKREVQLR
jgi:hypothetical protein